MIPFSRVIVLSLLVFLILGGCSSSSQKEQHTQLQLELDSLTRAESGILEAFFRTLFTESQGGYVLYGNKPVCIEAFPVREEGSIFLAKWIHVMSIKLKEGALLWKKLDLNKYSKDFLVFIYEKPVFEKWIDFVIINKREFLQIVEENLPLFQYVLGPKVTPSELLAKLTDPHETFYSVLHDDKVLIGILLGYGTENALFVSRKENIQETVSIPSFGFTSLHDEDSWLRTGSLLSEDMSEQKSPPMPCFGCYENKKTKALIKEYKKSQKQIAKTLQSDNFLEQVLSRFFDVKIHLNPKAVDTSPFPEKDVLTKIVAQSIWNCIPEDQRDSEYFVFFCDGLRSSEEGQEPLSDEEYSCLVVRFIETLGNKNFSEPEFMALRRKLAYAAGLKVWHHFKNGSDLYSFSEVLKYLSDAEAGMIHFPSIDIATDEILTHLHSVLYIRAAHS
jgi:hypothetical protein